MEKLIIVADDLTGAADSAARCVAHGVSAQILLSYPSQTLPEQHLSKQAGRQKSEGFQVVALSSDSRHLSPELARERLRRLLKPWLAQNAIWYKKIDSTLRGNVGFEIDEVLTILGKETAVICPAFPAQKRMVRSGHLIAPNVRPGEVHLPSLLREQTDRSVVNLTLAEVRADEMIDRMAQVDKQGAEFLAVDATADDDLSEIIDSVFVSLPNALLCGSGGMVGALASRLAMDRAIPAPARTRLTPATTSLTVIGSGHPVAHAQINALSGQKGIGVRTLFSDSDFSDSDFSDSESSKAADSLSGLRDEDAHWVIHLPPAPGKTGPLSGGATGPGSRHCV